MSRPELLDAFALAGAPWVLERRLGMPVASRGVPTVQRLHARLRTIQGEGQDG